MGTRDFAIDAAYGSQPLLEESGPIRLDELEGAVPAEECHAGDTLRICLSCTLPVLDCVCDREGA